MAYSPATLRQWLHDALHEDDKWPFDPVNRGILLAILYLGMPALLVGLLALHLSGWIDAIPRRLSEQLVIYALLAGWAVLDEWRSRRRSDDGKGHGWIWQMVVRYGPRRQFNRMSIAVLALAFVTAQIVAYVDRFLAADLAGSRHISLAELAVIIPLDIWGIAVVFGWRWAQGPRGESLVFRLWSTSVLAVLLLALIGTLASIDEGPGIWSAVPFGLFYIIFVTDRAIISITDRIRKRPVTSADEDWPDLVRPSWW